MTGDLLGPEKLPFSRVKIAAETSLRPVFLSLRADLAWRSAVIIIGTVIAFKGV